MSPQKAKKHIQGLLDALGLDNLEDPQLAETPARFAELLENLFAGIDESAPAVTTFPATDESSDPVVVSGIEFYSMCAHHLVPMFGTIDIGYIPDNKMIGFGEFEKIVEYCASRPQLQERLVGDIQAELRGHLAPKGLLIRARARQMCVELQSGNQDRIFVTTTSTGALESGPARREILTEFKHGG